MRVRIDEQKCNGAGVCVQELPQLFRFREGSKQGVPITEAVPPGLEKRVVEVAALCPAGAILVLDRNRRAGGTR